MAHGLLKLCDSLHTYIALFHIHIHEREKYIYISLFHVYVYEREQYMYVENHKV